MQVGRGARWCTGVRGVPGSLVSRRQVCVGGGRRKVTG